MLFNEPIHNWNEWGAIFQSAKAFTPLAKEIFHREKLAFPGLENLTPGTNAVFRAGDYVVKIFAPRESGMEPQVDYVNESAVCGALTRWGISTPKRLEQKLRDVEPSSRLEDCVSALLSKNALKLVESKYTVQINGTGGKRFYAIKLSKLK